MFVNLFQNSLDALKRKKFTDEKPFISIESALTGNKVVVTIRDNGEGIDATALDKIFDPFFTTKDVGEGMGLGLTICYRIVQEYDGHITVRSEPGKFCEFSWNPGEEVKSFTSASEGIDYKKFANPLRG